MYKDLVFDLDVAAWRRSSTEFTMLLLEWDSCDNGYSRASLKAAINSCEAFLIGINQSGRESIETHIAALKNLCFVI